MYVGLWFIDNLLLTGLDTWWARYGPWRYLLARWWILRVELEERRRREAGERNHGHDRDCIERTMVIVY